MAEPSSSEAAEQPETARSERTGIFTSGIGSTREGRRTVALLFTGRKHAGENLGEVLAHRAEGGPLKTIVANCTAHATRGCASTKPTAAH